jgi:uncharacterized membrane protein HdeD (DUF308 family)
MYQSSSMSGWSRALAIIFGLFIIGVGITAIFEPAIVVGFVTVLFAIAFIMLGFWALSMGISGQRVVMSKPPQNNPNATDRSMETQNKQ